MAIDARHTILISGGTSTEKTTLLNALASLLPPIDRIVLIEDTAELRVK
jgi:pilus assembly protein CpaF